MGFGREGRSAVHRGPQRTLTLDDTANAGRPANLRVNLWRWARRYPKWPVIVVGSLVLTVILMFTVSWMYFAALPMALIPNLIYWGRVREHFLHGDANPGLVVSSTPLWIAVRTDMTKGAGSYPMLCVREEPPCKVWGDPAPVGTRLATVALYGVGSEELDEQWQELDPRPVEPVAADPERAKQLLESFPSSEWEALAQAVSQVHPLRPGLFPVV